MQAGNVTFIEAMCISSRNFERGTGRTVVGGRGRGVGEGCSGAPDGGPGGGGYAPRLIRTLEGPETAG